MSIYVIEEDCVIGCVGRWYKLDFELMSLCPPCFCFLLFIPCMSNFIVLSLFSSSLRFHFFFVCSRCAKLESIYAYKWNKKLCNQLISSGTNYEYMHL